MNLDRYDTSVALQLWQRFFQLAMQAGVVSQSEDVWQEHRISALEYLARGKLMAICSLFFDGPVQQEDGDIDLYQAAQRGVALVRDDVSTLAAELERAEGELHKLLADRCAYIAQQGPGAVALELARVPEMTAEHRAWMQSPIAVARGAVVAAELERPADAMPPTSSAPAEPEENKGFNPAFFRPADNRRLGGEGSAPRSPHFVPAVAASQVPAFLPDWRAQLADHERRITALEEAATKPRSE